VSLFEAMDSIGDEAAECYEAVFDPSIDGWNADIEAVYSGGPIGLQAVLDRSSRRYLSELQGLIGKAPNSPGQGIVFR
jgi:hypothetical protein